MALKMNFYENHKISYERKYIWFYSTYLKMKLFQTNTKPVLIGEANSYSLSQIQIKTLHAAYLSIC